MDDWWCDLDDDDDDDDDGEATMLVLMDWHNDTDDWESDEAEPVAPGRESQS